MAKLLERMPTVGSACLLWLLVACGGADAPSPPMLPTPARGLAQSVSDSVPKQATGLPAWIVEPSTPPDGRVGKNNCTFAFGQAVPQWDFHPDAGCWEHAGPDGWTRQQYKRIHVPTLPACGGGPGDATGIRVCRAPGLANPCFMDQVTGPNGCARCVVNPVCH